MIICIIMFLKATLFNSCTVLITKDSKPSRNLSPTAYQVLEKRSDFYSIGIIPMGIILLEGIART